jgi:rod shape determining protein RodA
MNDNLYSDVLGNGLVRRDSLLRRIHIDMPLLLMLVLILGFGLLVLYSATNGSFNEVKRQATYIGLGIIIMIIVAQVEVRLLTMLAPIAYIGGVGLLVAVMLFGDSTNGAQRWLDLPGLPRFQPSELMKTIVPLCLASFLGSRALPPSFMNVVKSIFILSVPASLILMQPDLGTAILIGVSGLFVILLSGLRRRYIVSVFLIGLAALPLLWLFVLKEYQKKRVLTLLNPQSDPLGAGWNIIQSQTAIGSGGVYGKGWLNGVQSRLDFLPEGQTDFIFAVLSEEFGLFGVLMILALYLCLIGRGLYIAAMAPNMTQRLLAGSLTLTFFVYLFVNMGMVSGILPVVGVPLPLISLGGTSIMTLLISFGILMSIHTRTNIYAQS